MRLLSILTVFTILTLSVTNAQTRCDTINDDIFVVTEEMPQSNISFSELELILNSSVDITKFPHPDGNVVYVGFIINCYGEDFDYKVLKPIDKELETQLLSLIQSNMTWTPAKQRNRPVDFNKTI